MALLLLSINQNFKLFISFLLYIFLIAFNCNAQSATGILKGRLVDGSTLKGLYGATIKQEGAATGTNNFADGFYSISLKNGSHTLAYGCKGFQTQYIANINVPAGQVVYFDVALFPIVQKATAAKVHALQDSVGHNDTVAHTSFYNERKSRIYNQSKNAAGYFDVVSAASINAGNDKNGAQLLKRLSGVIVDEVPSKPNQQSLTIFGLGDRYNQVLLNGSQLSSIEPTNKMYPLNLLPVEAFESVSVQKIGNSAVPADFGGGTIDVKTKGLPDQNFFFIRAGGEILDSTKGKTFYGDEKSNRQALSFGGTVRDLPNEFPTPRSRTPFNGKNAQQKVYLSRQLNNNLAPISQGKATPNENISIGFGKLIKFKSGKKIGIIGFLSQSQSQLIDQATVQVAPDVAGNPFPFADAGKALIQSQANDINYRYASQLGGSLNATLLYGANKISIKNFFGSQLANTYTQRSQVLKPDEDTLAHDGIYYSTTQQKFLTTQLSGEHALGTGGKLTLNWQAAYSYHRQQNPDERNFLLRHNAAYRDRYEIAHSTMYPFDPGDNNPGLLDLNLTKTGRLWRNQEDNDFEAAVSISAPFNLFGLPQVISGGASIQTKNRVFTSTLLQVKGPGSYSLDSLMVPERYYPGGLEITNYYINFIGRYSNVYANMRGNYKASVNIGSSYIAFQNKLTTALAVDWGARVEAGSQLVSIAEYDYVAGYRNPAFNPLDKNTFVSKVNFLPSVLIKYQLPKNIRLHGAYFETLNRPQIQELTNYRYYDPITFLVKIGNPILQNTGIQNYDAGIDWLPNAGTSISISGFYKYMDQPIENVLTSYTAGTLMSTPNNMAPATIKGLELSIKARMD